MNTERICFRLGGLVLTLSPLGARRRPARTGTRAALLLPISQLLSKLQTLIGIS